MPENFQRRKVLWPWLTLLILSGAVIAGVAWDVWPRSVDLSLLRSRVPEGQPTARPPVEHVRVRLFFPQEAKATLVEQERELSRQPLFADAVRSLIQALIEGSGPQGIAPLPPTAQVRQVFLDDFGILYLDFHQGIQSVTAGDAGRAGLGVAAIVLTLTTNLSEVKRVQFLEEGEELTAQIGAADLRRPVQPYFPRDESQPPTSKAPDGEQ